MTVIVEPYGVPEFVHPGVRLRVRALLLTGGLDRELAAGVAPEEGVLLAVHAQRIVRPRACRALAATLRHLLAGRPGALNSAPISRVRVRFAAARLDAVAARLERDGPVAARGVAALRLLLSEGASPLYRTGTGTGTDLDGRLARILADLEPA